MLSPGSNERPQATLQPSRLPAPRAVGPSSDHRSSPDTDRGPPPHIQRVPSIATTHGSNASPDPVRNVPVRATQSIASRTGGQDSRARRRLPHSGGNPRTNVPATPEGSGRKSGRLRDKGPTTYTTKGEVFRGGMRVNEGKYGDMYGKGI